MPEKYLVKITPSAEKDFEGIFAEEFVLELEKKISTLEQFHERCPFIPEKKFLALPYRHLLHQDYRLIFFVEKKIVYVLRILHGKRLWGGE